ncbi:hypothetical protein EST38_g3773 [Candolleomyces aberdarensis]|uniref:Uncharacterized protein n=1 Tax=Candolleomyces aberdarensis TaxID=2316362 RepID=A0A4Q2DT99_9AGAR|nr:hypothetical protein EST38_g3773 [Candolleomyces aberdarensis]
MTSLFGISTIWHTGMALYRRMWWLLPSVVLCGALESLGWSARNWSHSEPNNLAPYQIQIIATIIAPTPLLAATFVIFGEIIRRTGQIYSRLSPRNYTLLFCSFDVISLVVQGLGGGLAATADPLTNGRDPETGARVMLGGIAFQLAVIVLYAICAVEFVVRYVKDWPLRAVKTVDSQASLQISGRGELTKKLKVMLCALAFSTIVLFIRAVYRLIELADGWNGRIIRTEVYFSAPSYFSFPLDAILTGRLASTDVLDGTMVVLAIYTLNFIHPACYVFTSESGTSRDEEKA